MAIFDNPLLLGFDQFERILDRVSKSSEGYPPYNIEQVGNNGIRITLAVAGFSEEDLSITIENRQLIIRGKKSKEEDEKIFLHRGIATRQFQKSFVLAEDIEIVGASTEKGLLHIDLYKPEPQVTVKQIKIKNLDAEKDNNNTKSIELEANK